MRTTRQLSITLPHDMADVLREKVSAGDYASESEVIREGLRALFAGDRAVEAWLQTEVAAAYDATVADPARTISPRLYGLASLLSSREPCDDPDRRHARG